MAVFLLVTVILLLFAAYGVTGHVSDRFRRHGPHALAWRWASGASWTGKAITNRGWTRPGTRALTATGHAHRRWFWPRWQHAAWRAQWTLAAILSLAALMGRPRTAAAYLAFTGCMAAARGAVKAREQARDWSHRRNYVKPLHARLHSDAGIPHAARPETWIDVPRDRSYARLTWPKGAPLPKPDERRTIETAAKSTLGMGDANASWQFTGPHLRLRLVPPVPAPRWVYLDRVEWATSAPPDLPDDAIRQAILAAEPDELILGIGRDGKVVKVSLRADSPHMALSVDTGGGKSVLIRCLVSQVTMRGGIALLLDNKLVSHPSLRGLENVAYADDIEKIHDALCWLDGELDRRAGFIREHTDVEGNLTGSPGPTLFVILEEQNLLMNRLRAYWSDLLAEDKARPKDQREYLPPVSPAIRGFENASYVGRELKVHLVFIAQRFTAEAAGGGSKGAAVRMNTGIRILAGYDDDTWKMLVGKQVPMPPPSKHAGRMQVYVKGGALTEVQVVLFSHAETRQFAQAGSARVPSKLRHLTEWRAPAPANPVPYGTVTGGGDGAAVIVTPVTSQARDLPPAPGSLMTIRQAAQAGMLPATWTKPGGAFRTAKSRAAKQGIAVPEVKAMRGSEACYDALELADFIETITRKVAA